MYSQSWAHENDVYGVHLQILTLKGKPVKKFCFGYHLDIQARGPVFPVISIRKYYILFRWVDGWVFMSKWLFNVNVQAMYFY